MTEKSTICEKRSGGKLEKKVVAVEKLGETRIC
jgi:hypothetical protein